jgi:hypothetical protein
MEPNQDNERTVRHTLLYSPCSEFFQSELIVLLLTYLQLLFLGN